MTLCEKQWVYVLERSLENLEIMSRISMQIDRRSILITSRHVEYEIGADKVCVIATVGTVWMFNVRPDGYYHHKGVST